MYVWKNAVMTDNILYEFYLPRNLVAFSLCTFSNQLLKLKWLKIWNFMTDQV